MKRIVFLILSLACLLSAAGLALREWQLYQSRRQLLAPGTTIAGVPVGGLDPQAAGLRLVQVYLQTPVELRYQQTRIHLTPEQAGFTLDLQAMLDGVQTAPWSFADHLFGRAQPSGEAPLQAALDEQQLARYLNEQVAPRYVQAPTAARPAGPGELTLLPGQPGQQIDTASAQPEIEAALRSLDERVVELQVQTVEALPPDFHDLDWMLEAVLQSMGYEGTIELYLQDVDSGEDVHLAYHNGRSVAPGIAFTAASTIKIPVMVSAYRRLDGDLPADLRQKMEAMIDLSDNDSTDAVMQAALDATRAPLQVTEDLRTLGLQDTFLAGFFYPGAPLLDLVQTPANSRTDLNTDPDVYNQTTPADLGRLLAYIERCAAGESGPLQESFGGQVTQSECQAMIEMLKKNRKGVLIEAGLPEGTPLAHKYGWVTDFNDGLMHTASDAGVVYTPGGRFALAIYLYDSDQLIWEEAQLLVARLTTAAYNFYNDDSR